MVSHKFRATAAEPVYHSQQMPVFDNTTFDSKDFHFPWFRCEMLSRLVSSCSSCPEFSSFGGRVLRSLSYPTSCSVSQVVSVCHGVSFPVLLDLLS